MNRDPRFALSLELKAKQTLLDQLRALAVEDPDFFTDLIEGETNLLELIAALRRLDPRRRNSRRRRQSRPGPQAAEMTRPSERQIDSVNEKTPRETTLVHDKQAPDRSFKDLAT